MPNIFFLSLFSSLCFFFSIRIHLDRPKSPSLTQRPIGCFCLSVSHCVHLRAECQGCKQVLKHLKKLQVSLLFCPFFGPCLTESLGLSLSASLDDCVSESKGRPDPVFCYPPAADLHRSQIFALGVDIFKSCLFKVSLALNRRGTETDKSSQSTPLDPVFVL